MDFIVNAMEKTNTAKTDNFENVPKELFLITKVERLRKF